MDGSEADGDLVLIQSFMLYYVNDNQYFSKTISVQNKAREVCIKTRSPSASHSLED